jgi:hypothetical protein
LNQGEGRLLPFELGLGSRVWVSGHQSRTRQFVERLLAERVITRPARGPIDVAMIVPRTCDEAGYFIGKICERLAPDCLAWIFVNEREPPSVDEVLSAASLAEMKIDRYESIGVARLDGGVAAVAFRKQCSPDPLEQGVRE